jgi:branched-chain amino acid transport system permease protein
VAARDPLAYYLPRLLVAAGLAVGLMALSALLPRVLNGYAIQVLVFVCCNTILALSLNLINGHAGQFSIGHAGFMAIGAYLTAWLSATYGRHWLAALDGHSANALVVCLYMVAVMVVGGLGAAVGGLLIGLPSLRLRGDYLAIATLGFGEIIKVVLLNVDAVGGARGLAGIPRYSSLFLCLGTVVLTALLLRNLINSVHGRALLAIREDETAAEAVGIDCTYYKTSAFVIGAFFAGVAGCLYAHYLQFIHPRGFDFMKSIELVLIVVLGGASMWGVIAAAVGVTLLPEALRQVKDVLHLQTDPRMVIYAVLLIGAMLLQAKGVSRTVAGKRKGGATSA